MYLECIMICINYSDFLKHTLPLNKKHFNKIVVVTTVDDIDTQKICSINNVNICYTNRVYENGAKFNKGKALNDGIKLLDKRDWVVITDADMIMNDNLRNGLESENLNNECIYGTSRYMCPNSFEWSIYLKDKSRINTWKHQKRNIDIGVGFFQLVNVKSSILRNNDKWYNEKWGHAGRSDRFFLRLWPCEMRQRLNYPLIHLDTNDSSMGTNWNGRITNKFVLND